MANEMSDPTYPIVEEIAGYWNMDTEFSEEEAVALVKQAFSLHPEYAEAYKREFVEAYRDRSYSWMSLFSRLNAHYPPSEEVARIYAKKMLWDAVFDASGGDVGH